MFKAQKTVTKICQFTVLWFNFHPSCQIVNCQLNPTLWISENWFAVNQKWHLHLCWRPWFLWLKPHCFRGFLSNLDVSSCSIFTGHQGEQHKKSRSVIRSDLLLPLISSEPQCRRLGNWSSGSWTSSVLLSHLFKQSSSAIKVGIFWFSMKGYLLRWLSDFLLISFGFIRHPTSSAFTTSL